MRSAHQEGRTGVLAQEIVHEIPREGLAHLLGSVAEFVRDLQFVLAAQRFQGSDRVEEGSKLTLGGRLVGAQDIHGAHASRSGCTVHGQFSEVWA